MNNTPQEPEQSSATVVDYSRLTKLLSYGKWQEAEKETEDILLNISGSEKGADVVSILNPRYTYNKRYGVDDGIECSVSHQDLHTIYDLWERYSNNFSSFDNHNLRFLTALKTKLENIWKEDKELSSTAYDRAYADDQKYRLD